LNLDAKSTTPDDDVDFQSAYIKDLIELTDYPEFNIADVAKMFKQWLKDKEEDILCYRDQTFTSVMTGTRAEKHHTPWLDEMDDSFERFIGDENGENSLDSDNTLVKSGSPLVEKVI
jgi:trimethylamine monooxygenase